MIILPGKGVSAIVLSTCSSGTYTFSRVFPIFFSHRATSSLNEKVLAGSLRYKVLFKVLGSSTDLIVNVPMSSSFTNTALAFPSPKMTILSLGGAVSPGWPKFGRK
eukprot:Gb_21750 [translate_table: standard]